LLVPFAISMSSSDQLAVRIDRLLVHSITLTGLVGLVGGSYLVIVLGLGRQPTGSEKTLLGLSMLAAAIAALLWVPARERLAELATRRVYGEGHAPDEVLRTFGSRLTRALPLDELLLQLAESLKATMNLEIAEVWTKGAGRLERAVSVPDRGPAVIPLGPEEETVVAHAGVSGPGWAQVWLPAVLVGLDEPVLRTAPVTNSGELLGLIVVRRAEGALPFNEADDLALTELARQVGLALHNVKLDSALQESLDAVRRQADELRASRARIVEATDTERRRIERDLHDGAQQHLVALAVGVRLARQISDSDPEQAKTMLDQIGLDLQEAVQELRNLAHGIYPPLLMDRGLPDALRAAAGRAALATTVEAENVGRYPQQVEAAVYFCCLEALQNAGKHAGENSSAVVTVREVEGALLFEVTDDGAGFDLSSGAQRGHGFVNMSDRVGAFGGSVTVDSAPGKGTKIAGRIPLGDM
jgi:signal transduction histidine kinase